MKIAILGYGAEGKSAEVYFQKHHNITQVFDNFQTEDLTRFNLDGFDLVFRSPSVSPLGDWSSITKYFFDRCPCPIIGVTGTKGKGTTCSMIVAILKALGRKVWLVGNIGKPALDILDDVKADDVVVYEMSSFQLWDLEQSPHVAVVLRIEPDHLNIHKDFADYVGAKANIVKHQSQDDYCVYYSGNATSTQLAQLSPGQKIAYPFIGKRELLDTVLDSLIVPGKHNREDAEAAIITVSTFCRQDLQTFLKDNQAKIEQVLHDFQGLPHRLQLVRTVNNVAYYDDNFSASYPSTDVALAAFSDIPIVLIAGGKDRGIDPTPARERIFSQPNLHKAILIGETKDKLSEGITPDRYELHETLESAFNAARAIAELVAKDSGRCIVLMSPGAPSFDMFKNFSDRGEQFQTLVKNIQEQN